MPAAALIAAPAVAGAVGGIAKGAKGTPDQVQNTDSTSQTTFAPQGQEEQALQKQSIDAYLKQQQLAGDIQNRLGGADAYQQAAQRAGLDMLNGQGFGPNSQETQQIADLRNALLQQSQGDINQFLAEGQAGATRQATNRGLRGQAASALQGQVLKQGSDQYGNALRQANALAAQQAISLPQQRIATQQGLIGQGLSLGDVLRQRALENQQMLQNPLALDRIRQERIAGGTTRTTGHQLTPGVPGSFGQAVLGGLTGAAGGAAAGTNVYSGVQGLQANDLLSKRLSGSGIDYSNADGIGGGF